MCITMEKNIETGKPRRYSLQWDMLGNGLCSMKNELNYSRGQNILNISFLLGQLGSYEKI